jgi:hypothetical protein
MAGAFVKAQQLNLAFYDEVVEPIVGATPHAAALLGWGSDVLGFDTERSTDHGWGLRLQVFVEHTGVDELKRRVNDALPTAFRGWPVRYGWDDVPVSHHVEVSPLSTWMTQHLGFDPAHVTTPDWLGTPQQLLLGVVAGAVYRDDDAVLLQRLRERLAWYPRDVWLWALACQWQMIAQEEAFIGRTLEVGDAIGARVLVGRLCEMLMRLAFLLERRYAPYSKWLGSAFARLPVAADLTSPLHDALTFRDADACQRAIGTALEILSTRHNDLHISAHEPPCLRPFYSRPLLVLDARRFARACVDAIEDRGLRSLPLIGTVDQLTGSTDAKAPRLLAKIRSFYREL